jgi:2-desacetyl-2-hydroxyethyl bacteriochlorophyllide A dehydrogenase
MLAAVFRRGELGIEELPTPQPGPGQVRVKVRYASICGSDLFLVSSGRLKDGTILGHEMSGEVEEVGEGVEGLFPSQGVIVRPIGCGRCPPCRRGQENLCPKRLAIGLGELPGAFGQYLVVPKGMIIPIPPGLDLALAALAEPMATALHAIRLSQISPGDRVVVIGAGGIGLCCVAVLRALGIEHILVSEPAPGRRQRALALGAQLAIDPAEENLAEACADWCKGKEVSAVIECAGKAETVDQALKLVSPGGKVALVGLAKGTLQWAPALAMLKELKIQGSFANTQRECRQCLDMMASGKIQPREMVEREVSLWELPEVFRSLMATPGDGKILVRVAQD